MNTKKHGLIGLALCAGIISIGLLCTAPPAAAQDSFHPTNVVGNAVNIATDPTNGFGAFVTTGYTTNGGVISTNGYYPGIATGAGVSVGNYETAGIYLSGYNANANASALTVKLVRSGSGNTPIVTTNARTWETQPTITISATTPAAAGPWYYYTNLDAYNDGSARWLGIASITNATASAIITNFDAGVVKKIRPVTISGGNW